MAEITPLAPVAEPRGLVPTDRQREPRAQASPPPPLPSPQPLERHRRGPRTSLADAVRGLDPRTIGGPRLPLVVLGLSALLAQWDDVALRTLLPEMRADFGLSLQFLLTLTSVLGVLAVLLAPAMGYLADRVKRVWMLRLGGLAANVGSMLQGLAPAIPQLVVGRSVTSVGVAIQEPAAFPLLTDYYPTSSRARAFAFLGAMSGLGFVIGPSVAGNLGDWFGWRFAVVSLGAVATLVTVALFFLTEPVRGYHDRRELGVSEEVARREQPPVSWAEGWRAAASVGTLRRLWYATPFLQVARTGMTLFIALYFAEEFGLGPRERGYIATLHGVFALAGILVAAPVADRLLAYRPGRVMVALGGLMFLYAASVLVLVFSPSLALSVVVGLPLGFGFVAIGPALNTLTSLVVPARIRGQGLQTTAPWQLVGLLLLPFIGLASDTWGLRRGLLVFIPIYLVGAVILISSSTSVARDMRAARAASLADEEAERARAQGRTKLLVCRDLDVHYGGAQAVAHVDFDVEEGEIVALIGANGAGKSSLLRAIGGTHPASNGAVFFDGRDITHAPAHENARRGIAVVPGGQGVFGELTVMENLRVAIWSRRGDHEAVKREIDAVLALFPVLGARGGQRASLLSGGEQHMLALAQAFVSRPRLLLIDELSLGLAPAAVEQVVGTLRELNRQGTAIVLVEQSVGVAARLAHRIVVMERGSVQFDGSAEALSRRPELARPVFLGGWSGPGESGRASPPVLGHDRSDRPALAVEDVSVSFDGVDALQGVTLDVMPGEVVGIVGPNGAGKTTVFDVVAGFVRPTAGVVRLHGRPLDELGPEARARLGLVRSFQYARLFPSLTVREHLAVAQEREMDGLGVAIPDARRVERRMRDRAEAQLERYGLRPLADAFVGDLSTGTRRIVDLACATAGPPGVLLLDEPSSGLADRESRQLALMLRRAALEAGWTLLVIEHDLDLVVSLAHRLVAMHLGRVLAAGPPSDVLAHPDVVAAYLARAGGAAAPGPSGART